MARRFVSTPAGTMALESGPAGLTRLYLPNQTDGLAPEGEGCTLLLRAEGQLLEYFQKKRRQFTLPLDLRGTPFRRRVWTALNTAAWGETITYGQLAAHIGAPGAARAVGQAVHCNPLPIFIPCHRVVETHGHLTGYAGGLALKQFLLELEDER